MQKAASSKIAHTKMDKIFDQFEGTKWLKKSSKKHHESGSVNEKNITFAKVRPFSDSKSSEMPSALSQSDASMEIPAI